MLFLMISYIDIFCKQSTFFCDADNILLIVFYCEKESHYWNQKQILTFSPSYLNKPCFIIPYNPLMPVILFFKEPLYFIQNYPSVICHQIWINLVKGWDFILSFSQKLVSKENSLFRRTFVHSYLVSIASQVKRENSRFFFTGMEMETARKRLLTQISN